jgi:hypothetical protein
MPTTVSFRLDAATPEDAKKVIDAIRDAGIAITPHHSHRPKRGDEGVYWDGQIEIPDDAAPALTEVSSIREARIRINRILRDL